MKKLIHAVLFMSVTVFTNAQISITDTYFPSIGDVLVSARANQNTVNKAVVPAKGTNLTWDYSLLRQLQTGVGNDTTRYRTADTSVTNAYPTADMMVALNDTQKIAINKTTTIFEVLGYRGVFIDGLPISIGRTVLKFTPPQMERRATLSYPSNNTSTWGFFLSVSANVLPASVLASLPVRPDSIRITYKSTRRDTVDGWGTIKIPGNSYPALREKRVSYNETLLEAKLPLFGWNDVTALASSLGVAPTDTSTSVYFWTNTAGVKEPIAVLGISPKGDSVRTATYKYLPISAIKNTEGVVGSIKMYPNPSKDAVYFDLKDWKSNTYVLNINDISGRRLHNETVKITGEQTIKVPLRGYVEGTYIATITDTNGDVLVSKTLVVSH
jgi:Secretion system C-terminal sorting domain